MKRVTLIVCTLTDQNIHLIHTTIVSVTVTLKSGFANFHLYVATL